jgi:hypothetical protein
MELDVSTIIILVCLGIAGLFYLILKVRQPPELTIFTKLGVHISCGRYEACANLLYECDRKQFSREARCVMQRHKKRGNKDTYAFIVGLYETVFNGKRPSFLDKKFFNASAISESHLDDLMKIRAQYREIQKEAECNTTSA